MLRHTLVVLALLSTLAACAPGALGEECTVSEDSNPCAEGLQCVATQNPEPDAAGELQCVDAGAFCSRTCALDSECADVGEGLICVNDCAPGACFVGSRG